MGDESTKRAAQEYLATRLSEEGLTQEETLNRAAAVALAPKVWQAFAEAVHAKCREWNAITQEETFKCKETALGDLRIWCAGRSHQLIVHYDSRKLLIWLKNSAREEHEPETSLSIEGYLADAVRGARLERNHQTVDLDMVILRQLRILAGLSQRAES